MRRATTEHAGEGGVLVSTIVQVDILVSVVQIDYYY